MDEFRPCILTKLSEHAVHRANDLAITFLEDGEFSEQNITYAELHARASNIASKLQEVANPDARVVIAIQSPIAFATVFFACLFAGLIAVPTYPPRRRESSDRFDRLVSDCSCELIVVEGNYQDRCEELCEQSELLNSKKWICVEQFAPPSEFDQGSVFDIVANKVEMEKIAFLQYTSGSTAFPKGVKVSHENLIANFAAIRAAMKIDLSTTYLSWLPLNHDMGLIGILLQGVYWGNRQILMSPAHFLQKPTRWLMAISRYQANLSGGPNFAYDLCVARAPRDRVDDLNLESWSVAFNGAEPIKSSSMQKFSETYEPYGFSQRSFFPCYGLAESTLFVTGGFLGDNASIKRLSEIDLRNGIGAPSSKKESSIALSSSGVAGNGIDVEICCPEEFRILNAGEVGEICVRSKCVTKGYWGQSTSPDFVGGDEELGSSQRNFMRTGDLGFLLNKELFVTGRKKDLIISRGRNIAPQDIEWIAEQANENAVINGTAAFSIEGRNNCIVVVQETKLSSDIDLEIVAKEIFRKVMAAQEIAISQIAFTKRGAIPRTTSGKIRRKTVSKDLINGDLPIFASFKRSSLVSG